MDQKQISLDSSKLTLIHSDDIAIFDVENTSSENQNGLQEVNDGSGSGAPSKKMNLSELKAKQIVNFSAKGVTVGQTTPKAHPQTQGLASEASSPPKQKSKAASIFHFSLIKIGNWERKVNYYKDLRAKIDYSRRKFAWEILDDKKKMKMKIEIKWSDILSMRVVLNDWRHDTLEVELEVPPIYFVEGEPKPQKYISWVLGTDFTGEQANLYRMLCWETKETLRKSVQWDDSTLSLSKKKFPSAPTPYFDVINQIPQGLL
ncbi:uncharacterized protein [Aristolochia californica]|uniref:uncharacterized protein n=1 Tax=Aristolochia californica TaxID=171875 RepID=UPI0035DC52D4